MKIEESKKEYALNLIRSLAAIESAIEPYKEQKRELRKEFIEKGYLDKDEIWAITKAYRMHCDGKNVEQFNDFFDMIAHERDAGKLP